MSEHVSNTDPLALHLALCCECGDSRLVHERGINRHWLGNFDGHRATVRLR